jgi:MFS family permease
VTRDGLIRAHPDFRRLWIGDGVSQLGTQVSAVAIPLLAASSLHASTWQVSLLRTFETAAFLVIGLPAGAWSDRARRRPVIIACDLGRAVLLASVPAAAALGLLGFGQLAIAAVLVGVFAVFGDLARRSYVTILVGRRQLVESTSRLAANQTVAYSAGPALGGSLVSGVGAPLAVLADALSFTWSAAWTAAIRTPETAPPRRADRHLAREIGAGLRFVFGQPLVRATTIYSTVVNLNIAIQGAVEILFLLRVVHLPAFQIGLLLSLGGLGSIAGALAAGGVARRLGQRGSLVFSSMLAGIAGLLVPLTSPGAGLMFFVIGSSVSAFGLVICGVVQVSLRQSLCPDELLGRMGASTSFLLWGVIPLGGLLGGALGSLLGIRTVLWLSAFGILCAAVLFAFLQARCPSAPSMPECPKISGPERKIIESGKD